MPRIVFAPKFPKALLDVLMEMKPAGFDLVVTEPTGPEFFSAVKGADYFMGFARNPLGPDFYAAAPTMKLVQLISAGYNTIDLEAARRARVPVANNRGANSGAVAEPALMKPTAILVNTCRGPVVDERALHKALITKRIAGAGLDVMVDEPPSKDNPLLNVDTCTITPHTAGPTWENWPKAFRNAFDNILRVHAGRPPLWVVPELRDLVR